MTTFFTDYIPHRSYGWMPLYGEETRNLEWVEKHLIPRLREKTSLRWKVAGGNLLHSEVSTVNMPDSDNDKDLDSLFLENNPTLKKLKNLYPVLEIDDFGYRLISRKKRNRKGCVSYTAFWALNTDRILDRGKIAGERFGL